MLNKKKKKYLYKSISPCFLSSDFDLDYFFILRKWATHYKIEENNDLSRIQSVPF